MERAFTVFALEADQDLCQGLDVYVTSGAGDAVQGLRDLGYWTWNTHEVLALITWLRSYNATAPAGRTVRVVGVDPFGLAARGMAGRAEPMAEIVLGLGERKVVFWGRNVERSLENTLGAIGDGDQLVDYAEPWSTPTSPAGRAGASGCAASDRPYGPLADDQFAPLPPTWRHIGVIEVAFTPICLHVGVAVGRVTGAAAVPIWATLGGCVTTRVRGKEHTMADSRLGPQAAKRSWVVLLYFYLAALVGLGFVITGLTMGLLGAKNAVFPGLDLPRYTYEQGVFTGGGDRPTPPTDKQLQEAKARATDDRRNSGLDGMLNGLIIAGVGAPVLLWHLKHGRALSAAADNAAGITP